MKEIPGHLQIALGEMHLNVREIAGEKHHPRILEYLAPFNLSADEISWCAAFVGYCLEKSGKKGTGKPDAKSYLHYGVKVHEGMVLELGDILIFTRDGKFSWMGHVGFFMGLDFARNPVVLGGNQDNCVCLKSYDQKRLIDIRRVI